MSHSWAYTLKENRAWASRMMTAQQDQDQDQKGWSQQKPDLGSVSWKESSVVIGLGH